MERYDIRFKEHPEAQAVITWTIFAKSLERARDYATRHLYAEYVGEAEVVEITRYTGTV